MGEYGMGKLPVVDESARPVGIVTHLDLARWLEKTNGFKDPALNALAKLKKDVPGGPYQ